MRKAFIASILESISDPAPKLVFADYLREQNEDDLAYAYEWCARNNKYPETKLKSTVWQKMKTVNDKKPYRLPHCIFQSLDITNKRFPYRYIAETRIFIGTNCFEKAMTVLAKSLKHCRESSKWQPT